MPSGTPRTLGLHPVATYREIARVLGCSWQNVILIEKRALAKLRREFRRRGIDVLDLLVSDRPVTPSVAHVQMDEGLPDYTDLGGAW